MYDHDYFGIIELNKGESKDTAANWIKSQSYDFLEWGLDLDLKVFSKYCVYVGGSGGIPQSYILDADKNIRKAYLGGIGSDPSPMTVVLDELVP